MAEKFVELSSTTSTDRLRNLYTGHTARHLSDGTMVFIEYDGTNYLLKHSGADHATVATVATLSTTDFPVASAMGVAVNSTDDLFVISGNNGKVKAFTKGAGYSWTAQTTLAPTTAPAAAGPVDMVWCNTGGGTNSKGHLMVLNGGIPSIQNARYWIYDAGAALAGSGTLQTASGADPTFSGGATDAKFPQLSNDGFGATSGLSASYDSAHTRVQVGHWAVNSSGALSTNASVGTATLSAAGAQLRLLRYASDAWAVVCSATTSSQYAISRWTSSARQTDTTNSGAPTNMPLTSGNTGWDAFLDPETANKVWVIALGTLSGTNLPVWRCAADVSSGVTWDGAATADDTLTNVNTKQNSMRAVQDPRGNAVDWQSFQKISSTNWALDGDLTGFPVSVTSEQASGTGAANAAVPNVKPNAGNAAGTGAANNPSETAKPTAGNAAGTGAAVAPLPSFKMSAGAPAGTGTAGPATTVQSTLAGQSAGTGAATAPTPSIGSQPSQAAGTGAASPAISGLGTSAEQATGTGTAQVPSATLATTIGQAAGTGAAGGPSSTIAATSEQAAGTGAAGGPAPSVAVTAEQAAGGGEAFDATVVIVVNTYADADLASGTGDAFDSSSALVTTAESSTGSGAAGAPAASLQTQPAIAVGSGAAGDVTAISSTLAGQAVGVGTASDPIPAIAVTAEQATGAGAANDPTVTAAASAGTASGTGDAFDATVAITTPVSLASGSGSANPPAPSLAPNATQAAATGEAFDATVATDQDVTAEQAIGTGSAFDATVVIVVGAGRAAGTGSAGGPSSRVRSTAGQATGTGTALDLSASLQAAALHAAGIGAAKNPYPSLEVYAAYAEAFGTAFDPGVFELSTRVGFVVLHDRSAGVVLRDELVPLIATSAVSAGATPADRSAGSTLRDRAPELVLSDLGDS